jgi:hypothetical protein
VKVCPLFPEKEVNRRDVIAAGVLAPSVAGAQDLSGQLRSVMETQWRREADLHDKLLGVWEWLDIWGDMLPDGAKADLLKSLGPDPGVRIDRSPE